MEGPVTMPPRAEGGPPRARLEGELERALAEHLPGLEIADRALELGVSGRRADLVGVDRGGGAVLILLVDGATSETALVALEALAFARANADLLARHVGSSGPGTKGARRGCGGVRVVLVAEAFTRALLEMLAVVAAEELSLFAVRELRSASTVRSYLLPIELASHARPVALALDDFQVRLAPGARQAADAAVRRIERIDAELVREVGESRVRWHLGAEELCALHRTQGELSGSIGGGREESALGSRPALELFLDRVVAEYVRVCTASSGGAGLAEPASTWSSSVPLLSAEELAAFRD